MSLFYRVEKTNIISPEGRPFVMRGVNVGGWLMMEGYILHAPNLGVSKFQKEFSAALGVQALTEFQKNFRSNFIREEDFRFIAKSGLNSVRVPFHHNLIERKPFKYHPDGLKYLDTVLDWGKKYKLGIILDLHAAPGAQNHDWHSDSDGRARLWESKGFQERVFALWEFLADRFHDNPTVLGYDLLNESVIEDQELLTAFYQKLISIIRKVDRNHILFVEGNRWAQDVQCLEPLEDDNMVASIHYYEPLEFSFNFVPFLKYPLRSGLKVWNKPQIRQRLEKYASWARKFDRPVHVGEFGVNARQGLFGEDQYLKDVLECFADFGFHWNYWTLKAIKNSAFPDGVYSYYPNSPWVARQGPKMGWDTYASLWPKQKNEIVASWRTENFTLNEHVYQVLKNAAGTNR